MTNSSVDAVFWDFGGVILTSPFEAFARYEREAGLPADLIRTINTTDPDANSWARFERSEIDAEGFVKGFEAEARALGYTVDGHRILACLAGDIRPAMVEALRRCRARLVCACLTNNVASGSGPGMSTDDERAARIGDVMELFHHVIESSKVGVRKPEPAFYELALDAAGVTPDRVVFLDDLGINLKPARAMGMRTIKVGDPEAALAELEGIVGFDLRA